MAGIVCQLFTQSQQMFTLTVPQRKCDCCEEIITDPPNVIVYGERVFLHERDFDFQEVPYAEFIPVETMTQ